jgi:hypothetical protein
LTHYALPLWESLTPSNKPKTWANMKMLMTKRFVCSNDVMPSNKLELPLLHDDCTVTPQCHQGFFSVLAHVPSFHVSQIEQEAPNQLKNKKIH